MNPRELARIYGKAQDLMRNLDGLHPQEAFDELLKYMYFKQSDESSLLPVAADTHAQEVRERFAHYLARRSAWSAEIWKDKVFLLSDRAITELHSLFKNICLSELPFDLRASALCQFLSPEIRSGLGIYLTPDQVAREAIAFLNPRRGDRLIDPACGSGTFLIEAARYCASELVGSLQSLWGADKNPRMLLLAELNMQHVPGVSSEQKLMDSLQDFRTVSWKSFAEGSFDFVATNPPFGVNVDGKSVDFREYETATDEHGYPLKRQQSEIMFLERCIRLLKPGGRLAIVLPRSAMSNHRLNLARQRLGKIASIYAAINLPPETFAAYGTQTNAVVLFVRRYQHPEDAGTSVDLAVATVTNVGYDLTGRHREGSQLPGIHESLRRVLAGQDSPNVHLHRGVLARETFERFSSLGCSGNSAEGTKLAELAEMICTGQTPPRASYADTGLFILKVGNLSGGGINWMARDRNFIDGVERTRRLSKRDSAILREGDIVLTSSAHSPVYIAKKVDIITTIPEWVGGKATFVGEVLVIRVRPGAVDPYSLLAFLRHPNTMDQIQQMVRGQTAHLHPDDLGNLIVPASVISGLPRELTAILREECELNSRLNEVARRQVDLCSLALV